MTEPLKPEESAQEEMEAVDGQPTSAEESKPSGEHLSVNGVDVPIIRAGMPDLFIALQPPQASPYIMAPRDVSPQQLTEFLAAHWSQVLELQQEMLKRYAKTSSRKCRYATGDVAYVMGRPFQLRVYPLAQKKGGLKNAARMRTTSKFSIDPAISLLMLYVVHPKSYDEAKLAFNGYAETVLLRNGEKLAADFSAILTPGQEPPPVRMRAMRGRWASSEAGALWLSTDLIPYPPDCLVYVIWRELQKNATISDEEAEEHLNRIVPGWRRASQMLAEKAEPFSLQ